MSDEVNCPVCGKGYPWDDAMAGKQMRCQGCQLMLALPQRAGGQVDLASDVQGQSLPEYEPVIGAANIDPYAEMRSPVASDTNSAEEIPQAPPSPFDASTPPTEPDPPSQGDAIPLANSDEEVAELTDEDEVMELSDDDEVVEADEADVIEPKSSGSSLAMTPLQPLPPSESQAGQTPVTPDATGHPLTSTQPGSESDEDSYDLAIDPEPVSKPAPVRPTAMASPVEEEFDEDSIGAGATLKRVKKSLDAKEEEEEHARQKQQLEDKYIPLGLIGASMFILLVTLLFIVDRSTSEEEFGISVNAIRFRELLVYFAFIALQLPFMFGGLYAVARLFGTSFGLIQVAILKIISIAMITQAVDLGMKWVLFHVTEGLPVPTGIVRFPFMVLTFGGLCMKLLEMDVLETFVFYLIVYMLPGILLFFAMGALITSLT